MATILELPTVPRRRRAPAARAPRPRVRRPDKHVLYEAAVQGVEYDLDLMARIYRRIRGHRFLWYREDFCGTAAMAAAWVRRSPDHRAWGVDIDGPTLDWARAHRIPRMRRAAERLELVQADVREVTRPKVDVVAANNYSYWVFKRRDDLVRYFRTVRRSLRDDGVFFVTAFGGSEALGKLTETTRIPLSYDLDGDKVPPFTYVWEHERFDVVSHDIRCHIHFKFQDGSWMRRAFTYDWRLWTLPEIRDALLEAGFRDTETWIEGWNEKTNRADEVFRLRKTFPNQEGWLAIVVGVV